ncbi:flavo protein-like protein [Absidia repens]|uniref:Flavo protein-like protein n=1 Tax=Absidia repens TaxID=90262 RepID=A0A1X2IBI8_9FUNG|nr:flavo protein-like protein [Absidia repens]
MDDQKPKIYIVLYSLYHHIYKLATSIAEGAEANGCEVKIFQVKETLSEEILGKMKAPPKPDLPVITAAQLTEADGILFGVPTRFGTFPAQVKTLLDATGSLWAKGSLAQKFAGFFVSCASQHGGFETTALTAITYLVHHGINFVPFGYPNPALFDNTKVICGSPYGAGTSTNGDGSRQPIEDELNIAKHQGENFAKFLATYHRGVKKLTAGGGVKEAKSQQQPAAGNAPPTSSSTTPQAVGTAAGATTATAAGAGAVAAGTAAGKKSNNTGDQLSGAPQPSTGSAAPTEPLNKSTGPISPAQPQQPPISSDTAQGQKATPNKGPLSQQQQQTQPSAAPQQEQAARQEPTKKKKGLWFCCGSKDDLD